MKIGVTELIDFSREYHKFPGINTNVPRTSRRISPAWYCLWFELDLHPGQIPREKLTKVQRPSLTTGSHDHPHLYKTKETPSHSCRENPDLLMPMRSEYPKNREYDHSRNDLLQSSYKVHRRKCEIVCYLYTASKTMHLNTL